MLLSFYSYEPTTTEIPLTKHCLTNRVEIIKRLIFKEELERLVSSAYSVSKTVAWRMLRQEDLVSGGSLQITFKNKLIFNNNINTAITTKIWSFVLANQCRYIAM